MKSMIPRDKKIKSTLKWRAGRRSTAATQSQSPAIVKAMFLKSYPLQSQTKKKRNDLLLADTCPQAANHFALFWVWEWTQVL